MIFAKRMQKLSDFDKFISFRNEIFGVRIFKGGGGGEEEKRYFGGRVNFWGCFKRQHTNKRCM